MVQNPPAGYPRVAAYLFYEDAGAAIDWLVRVFGFTERYRSVDDDGRVGHAELAYGDGLLMVGHPGEGFQSPKKTGFTSSLTHVYVDDVDAHHEHATREGADVQGEPTTMPYGDRSYGAKDLEGQDWYFSQHVADSDPAFGSNE